MGFRKQSRSLSGPRLGVSVIWGFLYPYDSGDNDRPREHPLLHVST